MDAFASTCFIFTWIAHTKSGDGMLNSVWAEESKLPVFKKLDRDIKTEVLIVGGGLTGILCAQRLAQAGVDYALIEADRICHGVSRNTTGKITSQHGLVYDKLIRRFDAGTARRYWEANEAALAQYRQLARVFPCNFETKDNYIYARSSVEKLKKEMAALDQIGVYSEFARDTKLPFSVAGAVRFHGQAQFDPLKLVSQIAKGLNIFENTAARAFEGNTVLTDRGRITAEKIIMATHFPIINKHGGYFLKMYQQRSYVLALENAADVDGMYLDEAKDGLSFRNYGDLLLLGGGGHRTGKQGGGWAALEAFAKKYYPKARVKYRWATQDCMTLDGIPYIGQYSRATPGLYVATGYNKWGMTSSMVAAMILSDLVRGRENPYAAVFSPQRTALRPQLLANALEATANLLTPTKPRCPHLGCALKWNSQERTWDCSCHGSRFTEDGKLLDNPATGDLKKPE